jgi:hypothetical protein
MVAVAHAVRLLRFMYGSSIVVCVLLLWHFDSGAMYSFSSFERHFILARVISSADCAWHAVERCVVCHSSSFGECVWQWQSLEALFLVDLLPCWLLALFLSVSVLRCLNMALPSEC